MGPGMTDGGGVDKIKQNRFGVRKIEFLRWV
jgi:hypothetical protein